MPRFPLPTNQLWTDSIATLLKLCHWMHQGVIGWNQETVGLIQYHPSIESLNAQLKCESGRGGQLHFHNIGNVGSSWITIDNRALESGLFQLSVEELATAIYWDLPIQLDQLFGLIHCHCYQTSLPSTLVNRHMLIPVSLAELFPCEASALNDNRRGTAESGPYH